jgi:hypothetical protein
LMPSSLKASIPDATVSASAAVSIRQLKGEGSESRNG